MAVDHPKSVKDYLRRVGAEVLNFRRAMVKIHKGHYYIERAMIRLAEDGSVTCSAKEFEPTPEEAAVMQAELVLCEFPKTIRARNTDELLPLVKGDLFEFIDAATGEIIMVQERRMAASGLKKYLPWVFLSTGEWVSMEPDGPLPFWKPSKELLVPGSKIMIHEGAKAAKLITELLADPAAEHPWREFLEGYIHWGMIGGALAPHRTDYQELTALAPSEVVYACDNDKPGESALQKVSRNWGKPMKGLVFGKAFPPTWDMGDPIPKTLLTRAGRYLGPAAQDLLCPATWATNLVPPPKGQKGRPSAVINPEFAEEWMHCVTPEVFVHKDWPNRILSLTEFDSQAAPFSDVDNTARLLKRDFSSKAAVLKYVPGGESGIYSGSSRGRYVNTYKAPFIKAEQGDVSPWLDFMEGLIPDENDRHELMRWCATLISRPEVKMLYGVLLISEMQGVGKGTLGEKILAPLVGEDNVSYPSEQEIVESNFNYWLAHKRLAMVHEIYAGNSSKAYNKLKSVITDRYIEVQKKYQANYQVENWIHVLACSNSLRALKISMDDRRWFIPKVSESKRPAAYWEKFNLWLEQEGGLSLIKGWADTFVAEDEHAVERGAAAPGSAAKRAMVEEGYSPGQMIVSRALTNVKERIAEGILAPDVFVLDSDLVALIRNELYEGRHNEHLERPLTVRNVAKALGWHVGEHQAQVRAWGPQSVGAKVLSLDPATVAKTPGELGGSQLPEAERRRPLDLGNTAGM